VGLGLSIFGWVGRDIKHLTQAVQDVGNGHLETQLDVHRKDEIGVLANAFRNIQYRMRTDVLTGLNNGDMIKHADQDMYERKRQSHLKSASRRLDQYLPTAPV